MFFLLWLGSARARHSSAKTRAALLPLERQREPHDGVGQEGNGYRARVSRVTGLALRLRETAPLLPPPIQSALPSPPVGR